MSDREATTGQDMARVVTQWLTSNPQVRERALAAVQATGKPPVDAFVSDPAMLVEAVRSVAIQAVERDAPEGVAESLLAVLRPMVATLNERERYRYSFDRLSRLEGLRDASEVVPVLEAAVAEAPDASNEARCRGALEAVQRVSVGTEATKQKVESPSVDDAVGCYLCGRLKTPMMGSDPCFPLCRPLLIVMDHNRFPEPFV